MKEEVEEMEMEEEGMIRRRWSRKRRGRRRRRWRKWRWRRHRGLQVRPDDHSLETKRKKLKVVASANLK